MTQVCWRGLLRDARPCATGEKGGKRKDYYFYLRSLFFSSLPFLQSHAAVHLTPVTSRAPASFAGWERKMGLLCSLVSCVLYKRKATVSLALQLFAFVCLSRVLPCPTIVLLRIEYGLLTTIFSAVAIKSTLAPPITT